MRRRPVDDLDPLGARSADAPASAGSGAWACRRMTCVTSLDGPQERFPHTDLHARRGLHRRAHAERDHVVLLAPAQRERLAHRAARGAVRRVVPESELLARAGQPPREAVGSHVAVARGPALRSEVDPVGEDRVDELRVTEVVPAEFVVRARGGGGALGGERTTHKGDAGQGAGEAAVDELRDGEGLAIEARVVEGAALEARPLGPDAAEVGRVEPAGPEDAAWPGREEGLETQVQGQAAEVAGDEGAAGEVEPVEAGPAEVDLREDSPTEGNDRLVRRTSFFGQIAFLRPLSCHFVEGAGHPPQGEV